MLSSIALTILTIVGTVASTILSCGCGPPPAPNPSNIPGKPDSLLAAQILSIMPTSSSCLKDADECRTANQAAPFVAKSFQHYNISTRAEKAALLGLMAFESVEFKLNTNKTGSVGEGTRNMQSGDYNLKYAESIPELRDKLAEVGVKDLNAVRELVLPDEYSFASAAWFLATQCEKDVRIELKTGSRHGWARYISECVGTEPEPRKAYWRTAVKALGQKSDVSEKDFLTDR